MGLSIHLGVLPTFTFESHLLQSKLVARKQGRCAEKASAGKEFCPEILLCFRRMGRAARAPSRAPLHRKIPVLRERTAYPPGPRNEAGLMVFSRNPAKGGTSGPGMASNSIPFPPTCRKVKAGKIQALH